jgi:hypothetical protein
MPNEPEEDELSMRQALVFSLLVLGVTAVLYLVIAWLVPMWLSR